MEFFSSYVKLLIATHTHIHRTIANFFLLTFFLFFHFDKTRRCAWYKYTDTVVFNDILPFVKYRFETLSDTNIKATQKWIQFIKILYYTKLLLLLPYTHIKDSHYGKIGCWTINVDLPNQNLWVKQFMCVCVCKCCSASVFLQL